MQKVKNFLSKPINTRLFYVLFFMIPLFYLAEKIVCSVYDSDMYFLIATGREILKHGIIHTNVWTIDKSDIVVQQWLYTVIMAGLDKIGYVGFSLFITCEFAVLSFLWIRFFSFRKIPAKISFFLLVMFSMPAQDYLFSVRPQIVTMILILLSCVALEHYRQDSRPVWLLVLPLATFAEMQFHMSMWFIHFAVLLAYAVPSFYFKPASDDSLMKHWKPLVLTACAMAASLFINPYGIDGVLYIVHTFKASTFAFVPVIEVNVTPFLSSQGATIILCVVLFIVAWKFGVLSSTAVNMATGFLIFMMAAVRNNTCSIFVMAFLMRDICMFAINKKITVDWRKDLKVYILPFLIFADLIFITNFMSSCQSVFNASDGMDSNLAKISDTIHSDYTDDMHIFTGFNCGGYFEYEGFKNIYIDARPELYTSEFTNNINILKDYSMFCVYGYNVSGSIPSIISGGSNIISGVPVTDAQMRAWLGKYDFDYMIVSPMSESFLSAYMLQDHDYESVPEVSDNYYILYRKVGLK